MKNNYLNSISKNLKQWTFTKLKEDSFYCQDQGNSGIIKKYLCEFNPNAKVEDLTLETIANSVKVSRYRNHLLIEHSYLDERDKHKPKQRFVNKGA